MKKTILFAATLLLSAFTLALTSCDDDDQPTGNLPAIKLSEVGNGNSKEAVAGKDLTIAASVSAENVIDGIYVTLQTHNGLDTLVAKSYTDSKYTGVKSTVFYEYIDVPANTPAGHYLLTFLVKDKAGKESIASSDVEVKTAASSPIEITISQVGENNGKTAVAGSGLPLKATIKAPQGLTSVRVTLQNDSPEYTKDFTFTYTDKYAGKTEADFAEELPIPAEVPAGVYNIHFLLTDAASNQIEYEVREIHISAAQK